MRHLLIYEKTEEKHHNDSLFWLFSQIQNNLQIEAITYADFMNQREQTLTFLQTRFQPLLSTMLQPG